MTDKPHISPSQLESYCRCPEAYRRRYLEGEKIPPGIAQLKGTGFHGGVEVNMRQKIESHEDLPSSDIVDAAVAKFEASTHDSIMLTEEEESRGAHVVLGEAKDSVVQLVGLHAQEQAPEYQPVLVEEKIRIELPGPRDLLGIIDLADDQDRVTDFKTAGRKKRQDDADSSVQLTVYAASFTARVGRPPSEVRLDSAIQQKSGTQRQVLQSQRDAEDFDALAHRINVVTQAVEAGSFPPATPGAWWCSERFCGYHRTCRFVRHTQRPQAAQAAPEPPKPAEKPQAAKKRRRKMTQYRKRKIKRRLWEQSQRCFWCGRQLTLRAATIDHVVPQALEGGHEEENLVISCRKCNEKRADTGLAPEHVPKEKGSKA